MLRRGLARCAALARRISGIAPPWSSCRASQAIIEGTRQRKGDAMSLVAPPADPEHRIDPQAFPELDDADLAAIRALAIPCEFEDGQIVFHAGDAELDLFVVE